MREIKFRAYDRERKYYVPQGEVIFKDYGETYFEVLPNCQEYIGDRCHHGEPQYSRFIIEQYTGLKDKNGVEIYEGDIIASDDGENTIVSYGFQNVDAFEGIGFNLWEFYGEYEDIGKAIRLQNSIKIIGNIHENPELLK